MASFLASLLGGGAGRAAAGPVTRTARLGLETLEGRAVPAGISFNPATGIITITGTGGDDTATVKIDPGKSPSTTDDYVEVTLIPAPSGGEFTLSYAAKFNVWNARSGTDSVFYSRHVNSIRFEGGDGNDTFDNQTYLPSWADGGNGSDTLKGGSANDTLWGGAGNDSLQGRAGNDTLRGGDNDDWLIGGYGKDYLYGDGGNDYLTGNHLIGVDLVVADGKADELHGGAGADTFLSEWSGGVNLDAPKDYWIFDGDIVV